MSTPTTYFIAGATRGIGLALTKELLESKTNIHIFAGARNPSKNLTDLASQYSGKVTIVPFVAADEASNKAETKQQLRSLAITIADYVGPVEETPAEVFAEHLKINVTGILVLFQVFAPLLRKSTNPKFIPFTSGLGSLTAYMNMPAHFATYGVSKAALNYLSRRIHFENEWIICFPFAPGVVETDMAQATRALDKTGTVAAIQDALGIKPDAAAKLLVGVIDKATRETHGGEFINIDDTKIAW